jgi:hypothetical protein
MYSLSTSELATAKEESLLLIEWQRASLRALFDLPWERQLLDAGYLPQGL